MRFFKRETKNKTKILIHKTTHFYSNVRFVEIVENLTLVLFVKMKLKSTKKSNGTKNDEADVIVFKSRFGHLKWRGRLIRKIIHYNSWSKCQTLTEILMLWKRNSLKIRIIKFSLSRLSSTIFAWLLFACKSIETKQNSIRLKKIHTQSHCETV